MLDRHPRRLHAAIIAATIFWIQQVPDLYCHERALGIQAMVDPSTVFRSEGQVVKFALHGFIEFQNLNEMFGYIDGQAGRWKFATARERTDYADGLLRRGIQSRLISMQYEKPLELLITHAAQDLSNALAKIGTPSAPLIFRGSNWQVTPETYRSIFLQIQEHWKTSLNCWSASHSIPARVTSNWYLIDEGITLFGARYDSTEHFWQAVKYHPDVKPADLLKIMDLVDRVAWAPWLEKLVGNQETYFKNTYALEFLRSNLEAKRREWFRKEVTQYANDGRSARRLQQRDDKTPGSYLFTANAEKVLWGDLADLFHLIFQFGSQYSDASRADGMQALLDALRRFHFDAVYLNGYRSGKMGFISSDFRELMLEIWKVKYLENQRLGDVIRSTRGMHLDHFLNDGDSPDIPIPVYVGYLNQIRDMALKQTPQESPR
jgi:hypothetical protein